MEKIEGRTTMATETALWTEGDEKVFQDLLARRRQVAKETLANLKPNEEEVETLALAMCEDYDSQDAWDNFLNWADPDEVRDTFEHLRG
jgi:hypothetical protein